MTNAPQPIRTHTAKLGTHRSNPRLWLEGKYLDAAGFTPGDAFTIEQDPEDPTCLLIYPGRGKRTISSKRRNGSSVPVLDINSAVALGALADASHLDIVTRHGVIEVSRARTATRIASRVATSVAVALFAGGGLLCSAAQAAGYTTVAAVEANPDYADTWQANHNGYMVNQPIEHVDFADLSRRVHQAHGPVGLLTVGQPCEAFSQIRRTHTDGTTKADASALPESHSGGDLFVHTIRAVEALNPHTICLECVPAFLDSAAGIVLTLTLQKWGYNVDSRILSPVDFGHPSTRSRCVLLATTNREPSWPTPLSTPTSLRSILLSPDHPECDWWTPDHPIKRHDGVPWPIARGKKQKAKGNGFACPVLTPDTETCPALTKRYFAGQGSNPIVKHPTADLYRWLTITEARRLMGLSPHYTLPASKTTAGEILGQGVHVPLFTTILAYQN